MNNESTNKLAGVIDLLLESSSRINEAKLRRYWYPLSMASYGVEEILEALDSMCSFRTTMWEKTLLFERRFAAYQNCADCVMVNSGSSADLLLCFMLTNPQNPILNKGDEVLIPIVTWPTQIWSAMMAGLKVKFVDVNPETLNIDINDLEAKITPKTKALFLVHLMGNPCKMDRILEIAKTHKLKIVEDCCEALGAEWDGIKVGNFGLGGSYSFFFSHHITTMEGGMIVCSDQQMADQLKVMRAHGWVRNVDSSPYDLVTEDIDPRYAFINWGFNLRPTDIQAGFGLCQLEKLPIFNQRREILAKKFFRFIAESVHLTSPLVEPQSTPSWLALPVMVSADAPFTRKDLTNYLEEGGIETRPIVAGNLAKQPVSNLFPEFHECIFPGANAIHERGFYIGLSPFHTDESLDKVCEYIQLFKNQY
jgi:CDP-6-deoxy-D-xylo-4-hexulose-3-dehydrase